jgi:hypothetical protein
VVVQPTTGMFEVEGTSSRLAALLKPSMEAEWLKAASVARPARAGHAPPVRRESHRCRPDQTATQSRPARSLPDFDPEKISRENKPNRRWRPRAIRLLVLLPRHILVLISTPCDLPITDQSPRNLMALGLLLLRTLASDRQELANECHVPRPQRAPTMQSEVEIH